MDRRSFKYPFWVGKARFLGQFPANSALKRLQRSLYSSRHEPAKHQSSIVGRSGRSFFVDDHPIGTTSGVFLRNVGFIGHRLADQPGLGSVKVGQAPVAPNVLEREFQADGPNQKWVEDFTYLWTAEGWLYVAVVLDLYSRRVVGWSMSQEMTSQMVTDALMMAVWRRGKPDALVHHPDRGSQYTSE